MLFGSVWHSRRTERICAKFYFTHLICVFDRGKKWSFLHWFADIFSLAVACLCCDFFFFNWFKHIHFFFFIRCSVESVVNGNRGKKIVSRLWVEWKMVVAFGCCLPNIIVRELCVKCWSCTMYMLKMFSRKMGIATTTMTTTIQ